MRRFKELTEMGLRRREEESVEEVGEGTQCVTVKGKGKENGKLREEDVRAGQG